MTSGRARSTRVERARRHEGLAQARDLLGAGRPYLSKKTTEASRFARTTDPLRRPLGANFRVNHTDIVAMHSAIAEVGVLTRPRWCTKGWTIRDPTP